MQEENKKKAKNAIENSGANYNWDNDKQDENNKDDDDDKQDNDEDEKKGKKAVNDEQS